MNVQLITTLLSLFWFVRSEVEDGVSYMVRAGKRDCFYRELKPGDEMDFDLQVVSGADLDITVHISSPTGVELLFEYQQTEISREIKIQEKGPVEICFDNSFSTFSDKVVYFDLGITEQTEDAHDPYVGLEKDEYEHRAELMSTLEGIAAKFEKIEAMQAIVRSKHMRHEYLQSRNLWRVTYFSTFSCTIMILVGVLQVFLIRNLFESKIPKGMQSSL